MQDQVPAVETSASQTPSKLELYKSHNKAAWLKWPGFVLAVAAGIMGVLMLGCLALVIAINGSKQIETTPVSLSTVKQKGLKDVWDITTKPVMIKTHRDWLGAPYPPRAYVNGEERWVWSGQEWLPIKKK